MTSLESQPVVVTGAGSGIGRAVARMLGAADRHVIVADIDLAAAQRTVDEIAAEFDGKALAAEVDVSLQSGINDFHDTVVREVGVPSTVVNCAGWDRIQPFLDNDPEFWDRIVGVNYLGTVRVTHAFARSMVEHSIAGRIVNISSDAGRVGSTGETVYAGAKGGVIAFTKSLARELARYGITVNCVAPGPTDTPLFHQQPQKLRDALIRAIPLRRLAQPEEIAAAVGFFASERSGYITGQVLSVSGGLTLAG